MSEPPVRVSVAMCTHNGERYLERQLASILEGSQLPDELVIIDDASTDSTWSILEAGAEDARRRGVTVRTERNAEAVGVTANFERAIRACTGDLLVLADQDDVWHPDRLAAAVAQHARDRQALFIHGDAQLIDGDGRQLEGTLFARLEVSDAERADVDAGRAFPVYLRRNLATGATSSFRRELLEDALPFPGEWVHDEWLAVLAAARERIRIESSPLISYRVHGANQIGVARPTLGYKIGRVVAADAERNAVLARRSEVLAQRLRLVQAPDDTIACVLRKVSFEDDRARLPRLRIARLPRIAAWLVGGRYRESASRGRLDAVRDLLRR